MSAPPSSAARRLYMCHTLRVACTIAMHAEPKRLTFFRSANVIIVGAFPMGAIFSASCRVMLPVYFRVSCRFSSGVAGLM
jgi:hypothetical protein